MESHPLSPSEWGNHCWRFLHASSFTWPDNPTPEQQKSAKQFYNNLGEMLPCQRCRAHYNYHIRKKPPKVDSKDHLSRWLVDIHNEVNVSQGKSTVDYDQVKRHYEQNTKELSCETVYVKYLQKKMEKKDLALQSLCAMFTIVAIIVVVSALKKQKR